jgi:acetyl esterase/lipase
MRSRLAPLVVALLLAFTLVGCSDSSTEPDTSEPAATQPPSTTATTEAPTTAATSVAVEPVVEVEVVPGVVYHSGDERFQNAEQEMDVVAPTSGGPWPVVVAFHGGGVSKEWSMPMSTAIAEQGRVVFVPNHAHTSVEWRSDATLRQERELVVAEVRCAVAFAKATAADYGGDPDHVTVMGYSFGGNSALMAAMSDADPLEACVVSGPGVEPQAVVNIDGDVLHGPPFYDAAFADDPDAFYAFTPWRDLDPDDPFPVHVISVDTRTSSEERSVEDDRSWVDLRHVDIDLDAELDAMGVFDDGVVTNREANEWAYETLVAAGYDTTWLLLPDSHHAKGYESDDWGMSPQGWQLAIDTVLNAENG